MDEKPRKRRKVVTFGEVLMRLSLQKTGSFSKQPSWIFLWRYRLYVVASLCNFLGLTKAREKGIAVTTDQTFRSDLWKYGRNNQEVLAGFTDLSSIFIGGVNEINEVLESDYEPDEKGFVAASKALLTAHPSIERFTIKYRR